eukprot:3514615-Amphidinium_carterae.3
MRVCIRRNLGTEAKYRSPLGDASTEGSGGKQRMPNPFLRFKLKTKVLRQQAAVNSLCLISCLNFTLHHRPLARIVTCVSESGEAKVSCPHEAPAAQERYARSLGIDPTGEPELRRTWHRYASSNRLVFEYTVESVQVRE